MDLTRTHRKEKRRRLAATLRTRAGQLYKQFRTLTRAIVHPGVPSYVKLVCGCAVLYVVSPIQLIPNFIPIIGQLDDVLVIGLSIRLLKRSASPTVLEECQNASRPPREIKAIRNSMLTAIGTTSVATLVFAEDATFRNWGRRLAGGGEWKAQKSKRRIS
jgi:uncharacterized membrane protein YkvA (DUF1232 family)